MVGLNSLDDAGVYRLSDEMALVQTVDFFTAVVDDPYQFGAIAAANAISDVYAMGGEPLLALNLVGFPLDSLPATVLSEILQGGADKAREAGVLIIGGHTIEDKEPKYGMAVTGTVHPERLVSNGGAQPGDVLVLTKPIGTGILTTAAKAGMAPAGSMEVAIAAMATLNRDAAAAMNEVGANACTDVTGFGLLGHAREVAVASKVDLEFRADAVPLLRGAREAALDGRVPGGTRENLRYLMSHLSFENGAVDETTLLLLADAQTSGGLLISVPESRADALLAELARRGVDGAVVVGRVTGDSEEARITIV